MSDFKIIETQEQLDAVISERLKRAEEKYKEKYSDYDDLKTQLNDATTKIDSLNKQLEEANGKVASNDENVAALNAKIAKYETDSVKTRIALEKGLPYEFASRLSGDDEESITKDAEAMALLMKSQQPAPPLRDPEPAPANSTDAAYASMLKTMKNGGK